MKHLDEICVYREMFSRNLFVLQENQAEVFGKYFSLFGEYK